MLPVLVGTFAVKPEQINDSQAMKCVLEDFCRPGKGLPLVLGQQQRRLRFVREPKIVQVGER